MAIVYRDIYNNFAPIRYNGTNLPYGITMPMLNFTDEEPVTPPSSPRPEGEVLPRLIFHGPPYPGGPALWFIRLPFSSTSEMKSHQHKFSKYPSRKNKNKILRRNHKLKQPGGSSCNQRR